MPPSEKDQHHPLPLPLPLHRQFAILHRGCQDANAAAVIATVRFHYKPTHSSTRRTPPPVIAASYFHNFTPPAGSTPHRGAEAMAVPSSDRARRPFPLSPSLSLFLLISAILVLLFLFLDPSPGSLAFLPSRLSASAPSLAPPLTPQQQSRAPRSRSPPHSRPDGSSATEKAEEGTTATASQPVTKADANGSASGPSAKESSGGSGSGGNSGARGVGADGETGTSVVAPVEKGVDDEEEPPVSVRWQTCSRLGRGVSSTDYIPCLDNVRAIKALRSRRHMEHRERHCPLPPRLRCLVPLPAGYRTPVPWPRSRDMVRTFPALASLAVVGKGGKWLWLLILFL